MTRKRIIQISLLSLILIICIIPIMRHCSEFDLSDEEIKIKKNLAKAEYVSLFLPTFKQELKPNISSIGVTRSKYPFLTFNFGSKDIWNTGTTHEIIVHKVILKSNKLLEKLVQFEKGEVKQTDRVYAGNGLGEGNLLFTSEGDSLIDNIYLTYDGQFIKKSIFGDSLVNLSLQTPNFAIAYEKDVSGDIVFVTPYNQLKKTSPKSTFTITFYKKGLTVYFIIIRQNKTDTLEKAPLINKLFGFNIL